MATIKLKKREYPLALPDFAAREELTIAWHAATTGNDAMALRRVAACAVALCTPALKLARLGAYDGNVAVHGGAAYSYLREHGADLAAIIEAGGECVRLCAEAVFPREAEVEKKADFFGDEAPPS